MPSKQCFNPCSAEVGVVRECARRAKSAHDRERNVVYDTRFVAFPAAIANPGCPPIVNAGGHQTSRRFENVSKVIHCIAIRTPCRGVPTLQQNERRREQGHLTGLQQIEGGFGTVVLLITFIPKSNQADSIEKDGVNGHG